MQFTVDDVMGSVSNPSQQPTLCKKKAARDSNAIECAADCALRHSHGVWEESAHSDQFWRGAEDGSPREGITAVYVWALYIFYLHIQIK